MPADEVTSERLAAYYTRLSNEELLGMLRSGELTPLAEQIAASELRSRGIEVPETASDPQATTGKRGGSDLVLLARFLSPMEAEIVRGRLRAEGVEAVIADAQIIQVTALMPLAFGGVRILAPTSQLQRARSISKDIGAGASLVDDQL